MWLASNSFIRAKATTKPTAAHLRHSRVRSTGQRVAQTTGPLKPGAEIALRAAAASWVSGIGLTVIPPPSYARAYDHKDFSSHRSRWICRHLFFAGASAESG